MHSVALVIRIWAFAGAHSGSERAAAKYSILRTQAQLTETLSRISAGHRIAAYSVSLAKMLRTFGRQRPKRLAGCN
jgi:hypothetical protein